jgi:hypothetical protein
VKPINCAPLSPANVDNQIVNVSISASHQTSGFARR